MERISTRIHGVIDYATALILIVVPLMFLFGGAGADAGSTASTAAWVLIVAGLALLGLSLKTRYELGAVRVVPMRAHLAADIGLGAILVVSPWLFGFASLIWWPHVLVGLMEIVLGVTTRRRSPVETPATAVAEQGAR